MENQNLNDTNNLRSPVEPNDASELLRQSVFGEGAKTIITPGADFNANNDKHADLLIAQGDASSTERIAADNTELATIWKDLTKDKIAGVSAIPRLNTRMAEISRERLRDMRSQVDPEVWARIQSQSKAVFSQDALGQNLLMLDLLDKELHKSLLSSEMKRMLSVRETTGNDSNAVNSMLRLLADLKLNYPQEDIKHLYGTVDKNLKCLLPEINDAAFKKLSPNEQRRAMAYRAACTPGEITALKKNYNTAHEWLEKEKKR
jgi:hypothetical protein